MINLDDYPPLLSQKETLAQTATDPQNPQERPLTISTTPAINFDKVKNNYVALLGGISEQPCSVDALIQYNGIVSMVEFKNGKIDSETKRNIKDKIHSSLLLFCDITQTTISETRQFINFILVYNEEKNPPKFRSDSSARKEFDSIILERANEEAPQYKLGKYKGIYFHKVYTFTPEEFEEYISKNPPS